MNSPRKWTGKSAHEALARDAELGRQRVNGDALDEAELIAWDEQQRRWFQLMAEVSAAAEKQKLNEHLAKRDILRRDIALMAILPTLVGYMLFDDSAFARPEVMLVLAALCAWALRGGCPLSVKKSTTFE